jgi:hypothetical protein
VVAGRRRWDTTCRVAVKYYRHRWNEGRGDAYDHWGHATYYLAVADDDTVVEQAEVYDNGCVLVYDENHAQDEFGMLADQRFEPVDGIEELDEATFSELVSNLVRRTST